MLFDEPQTRTDEGPATYSESHFGYLNRSARAEAVNVRAITSEWFARLPEAARPALRARFRSSNKYDHYAAFTEIYCHELCRALGLTVEMPSPDPGRASRRSPDFLLDRSVFLEATIATDESREEMAANARLSRVYDALNRVDSPNFFLRIEVHGAPSHPVPGAELRRKVEQFMSSLDPDECLTLIQEGGLSAVPMLRFTHGGWRIDISPYPKSRDARGRPGIRPVGMTGPAEAYRVDNRAALRTAVIRKARHYGRLDSPFVVAVNTLNQHLEFIDIMEALFGQERYLITVQDGRSGEPQMERVPNGAWFGPRGAVNTRVSAVLIVSSLTPWTLARSSPVLVHNPYARHPLSEILDSLTHYRANGNQMVSVEGRPVTAVLGISERFPYELRPPTA
jgi:hypothetical protein